MNINDMKESKFVTRHDVGNGKNVIIKSVVVENVAPPNADPEEKWVCYFNNARKGLVLNQTNANLIAHIIGSEETSDWTGHSIQLYDDPSVSYAGKIVGGVRVRPAQGNVAPIQPPVQQPVPNNDFDDDVPF